MKDNLDLIDLVYEQELDDAASLSRPLENKKPDRDLHARAIEWVRSSYCTVFNENILLTGDLQKLMVLLTKEACDWKRVEGDSGKPYFHTASAIGVAEMVNQLIVHFDKQVAHNHPLYHVKLYEIPRIIEHYTNLRVDLESLVNIDVID